MKPLTDKELWDELYKCSHTLSDLTEKHIKGDNVDLNWCVDLSRGAAAAALELERRSKGLKPHPIQ